ncbi:MAG: DUF2007 domain-containing protein [Bacteroidales bacterium]|nr:DUF2007 domain-containing protein [Bacteroidales bacterium]MCF8338217.1 DUF2007 domain-containing protein [Bacteroidales bacterium]
MTEDDKKTVRLMTCNSVPEAHMIKGRLNNMGIDCFLKNEESTNMLPMFNNMVGGGVQVMVFEKDLDQATEIINKDLGTGEEESE